MIKIWVDDIRQAPEGYHWCKSVNETIDLIKLLGQNEIALLDLDHDSGAYYSKGKDYINILNWIEEAYGYFWKVPIHIHSFNPVGRENMERIIWRNRWYQV